MTYRILLVDNDKLICEMLSEHLALTFKDVELMCSHTLEDAQKALEDFAPDVVILEMILPDQMGIDLLPTIRRQSPKARVGVLSALSRMDEFRGATIPWERVTNEVDYVAGKPAGLMAVVQWATSFREGDRYEAS